MEFPLIWKIARLRVFDSMCPIVEKFKEENIYNIQKE